MSRRSLFLPVVALSLTLALVSAPSPRTSVLAQGSAEEAPEYTWTVLEDRLTMRPDFNALKGHYRARPGQDPRH